MKIHFYNETKANIDKKLVTEIAKTFSSITNKFTTKHKISKRIAQASKQSSCNLIAVSKRKIQLLNNELFDKNLFTDVISINASSNTHNLKLKTQDLSLGDIYICPKVIKSNANDFSLPYKEELARIIIHGILHLLGFDHKESFGESEEEMFQVQEEIVRKVL